MVIRRSLRFFSSCSLGYEKVLVQTLEMTEEGKGKRGGTRGNEEWEGGSWEE